MDRETAEKWAERFNQRARPGATYGVEERRGRWRVVVRHDRPRREWLPTLSAIAGAVAAVLFWGSVIGGCGYILVTTDWSDSTSGAGFEDSDCDPNYEGACVPAGASDVDCAGGDGDGPEYVEGPVAVVGDDPYDLDRDGDGQGCE